MREYLRRYRERLLKDRFFDLGGGCEDTILLAGCARSGSTWVSDIINYDNAYRYIFEPFRNDRAEICRIFKGRQYLRPGLIDDRFFAAVEQVLTGQLKQRWSDKHNAKLISRQRLVKAIRVNLMLKWLRDRFPSLRILFLIRHPLAVVSSKLKLDWPVDFGTFLGQESLMDAHLDPFRDLLASDLSPFEKHMLFWCIEHYVPLRELSPEDLCLVFYEGFCTEPEYEIGRMFEYIGRGSVSDAMKVLSRPSSVTTSQAAIHTGASLTHGWERHVTEDQRSSAVQMLTRFGLDHIYLENGLPNRNPGEIFISR